MRVRVGGEQKKMTQIFESFGSKEIAKKQEACSIYLPQERYQPPLFEVSPREHDFYQYCCHLNNEMLGFAN